MGLYVNPTGMTKEAWIDQHAVAEISPEEMVRDRAKLIGDGLIPLVLVNNGPFTALAVVCSARDAVEFTYPGDRRPKRCIVVDRIHLADPNSGVGEAELASNGL